MEEDYKVCNKCGKKNLAMFSYCAFCGSPLNVKSEKTVCKFCEAELEDGIVFCPNCGKKQNDDAVSDSSYEELEEIEQNDSLEEIKVENNFEEIEKPSELEEISPMALSNNNSDSISKRISQNAGVKRTREFIKNNKNSLLITFRNIIVTAFCAVLFILSFFPVVKIDVGDEIGIEDADFDLEFSAIDMIDLMVAASKSYSVDDLEDTDEYDEVNSIDGEKFFKWFLKLSDEEVEEEIHNFLMNNLKLKLMNEDLDGTYGEYKVITIGVVGLLYITFAFVIFLSSLLNLILYLTKKKDLFSLTVGIASSFLPISIMTAFVFFGIDFSMVELAGPMIAIFVLISILVVSFIIYALFKNSIKSFKNYIPQFITIGTILVVLGSMFAPIYTVEIDNLTVLRNHSGYETRETNVDIDIYADALYSYKLSKNEIDNYEKAYNDQSIDNSAILQSMFNKYAAFTKKDIENGNSTVNSTTTQLFVIEFACGGGYNYSIFWALSIYVLLIICCLLALLMGIATSTMITGKKFVANMVAIQIIVIFLICLILGLIIGSIFVIDYNFEFDDIANCKINIGASPIVMLVFALIGTISAGVTSSVLRKKQQI